MIVIFNNLDHVADYSQRPMPKIALQAVQFVFWVSLVIGTLDNHHTNFDEKSGFRHKITHPILLLLLVSNNVFFIRKLVTEYHISANSFLSWKVPPFNSFHGNYSIYKVKNCHNAETILKFPHFPLSKKNSFRRNYKWKYSKSLNLCTVGKKFLEIS